MQIILNDKEAKEYIELKKRLKELCDDHNYLCNKIRDIVLALPLVDKVDIYSLSKLVKHYSYEYLGVEDEKEN